LPSGTCSLAATRNFCWVVGMTRSHSSGVAISFSDIGMDTLGNARYGA